MSLTKFIKRCQEKEDGIYVLRITEGMEFTDSLLRHAKSKGALKRLLILELMSMRYRFNELIEKYIRELLDEE